MGRIYFNAFAGTPQFGLTHQRPALRERRTVTTRSSRATLPAMRRFRPRQDYSRKLTRRITLADRTRLETLKDAADLFTGERFAGVTAWPALEHAIEL